MRPVRITTCPSPETCDGYYLVADLPPDHPQAGKLLPCACTRARQSAAIRAKLPPKIRAMTFDTFRVEKNNRAAFDLASQLANDPWGQERYWLVLLGPNQCGKTHLAAAVVNALLARGEPASFESVPELLDDLRDEYSDSGFSRRFERVKAAPVLALDDLGLESGGMGTEAQFSVPYELTWAQDNLYQIFEHRLVWEMSTIITTNVPLDNLPARIASRLQNRQSSRVAVIQGDSRVQR
jgi:DNA replication protein DnaC